MRKKSITVYPNPIVKAGSGFNPYIFDFMEAMRNNGFVIANQPHKNPLVSLLTHPAKSDYYLFHWVENVPDYKYGGLQFLLLFVLMLRIRICGGKVVWFFHNKESHARKHRRMKRVLYRMMLRCADLIVTHSKEGVRVIEEQYPHYVAKTLFAHHPTKERFVTQSDSPEKQELLIWGAISPYKGVHHFVAYLQREKPELRVKIVGRCSDPILLQQITDSLPEGSTFENRVVSFDELPEMIRESAFVLIPYNSESVLSSGALMDSLSFGAKVIGPDAGSFRDYANEPELKVFTFTDFQEIPEIVKNHPQPVSEEGYRAFLHRHNWDAFARLLGERLERL